jgi:hypothetical protein
MHVLATDFRAIKNRPRIVEPLVRQKPEIADERFGVVNKDIFRFDVVVIKSVLAEIRKTLEPEL